MGHRGYIGSEPVRQLKQTDHSISPNIRAAAVRTFCRSPLTAFAPYVDRIRQLNRLTGDTFFIRRSPEFIRCVRENGGPELVFR